MKFKWLWCTLCDIAYIECPYCGNNCCNAMTDILHNGDSCGCKKAYAIQKEAYAKNIQPKSATEIK